MLQGFDCNIICILLTGESTDDLTDSHFAVVATKFTNETWEHFKMAYLCISDADVEAVLPSTHTNDGKSLALKVIKHWQNQQSEDNPATVRKMYSHLATAEKEHLIPKGATKAFEG